MNSLTQDDAPVGLDDVGKGLAEVEAKTKPDSFDLLEAERLEKARLENKLAESKIANVEADRDMRITYAGRILRYLEFYSAGVAIVIILSGFKPFGFSLETGVLATLVGSTAVAAIGLVGFIARGLFRAPSD